MASKDIKALIKERGLTYAEIGAQIGVTAQAISNVVNGTGRGKPLRWAIATVLGVEVVELWPEDDAEVAA